MNCARPTLLIAGVTLLVFVPLSLPAQTRPEIGRIAARTAKKVAKTSLHTILTTPLSGCLGAPQLCAEFDTVLQAELAKSIPNAQFIQREEAVKHLADHGFLSIDAYLGALDNVASDVGAEVVIDEDFVRKRNRCELHASVADAKHLYALADLSTGISCLAVSTKTTPSLLKDPGTGASLVVPMPQSPDVPPGASLIHFPTCLSCPNPHYSGDALQQRVQGPVRVLITVTEQGTVEHARAVSAVEESLARASLQAVNGWQFKPAVGPDGKPFSVRLLVEVTFRLLP